MAELPEAVFLLLLDWAGSTAFDLGSPVRLATNPVDWINRYLHPWLHVQNNYKRKQPVSNDLSFGR